MESKETILILTDNLFFVPRVQIAAEISGYDVIPSSTESEFWNTYSINLVPIVVIDLEIQYERWTTVVTELLKLESIPYIIAFGPHSSDSLLKTAREVGCHKVLTKSQFDKSLNQLFTTPSN